MKKNGDFPWGGISQPGWGSFPVRNKQESETEARPLREAVSMATEAGGPKAALGGRPEGRRADGVWGYPRGSRKSVPRLASSSDNGTHSPSTSSLWP